MKLTGMELRRVRLSLVAPFRTSFGVQTERDLVLLRATTPEAEGWAECVAGSEPAYSSEYVDAAQDVIERYLAPKLFEAADLRAQDVAKILAVVKGHRMAKAAVETAVLDAELRETGQSLGDYLGGTRDLVDVGVSVGIMDGISQLLDAVGGYLEEGYRRIKLKIEPGWDIEPVKAVRERFGGDLVLQVDANAAYTLPDAGHLSELDAFDLLLIEQPFGEEELLAHAQLAKVLETPVCLDESITSARAASDALAIGACRIVNIKPGRVGGYLEARKIHDLCEGAGVPVWCGGMLETGVGRAANLALASLPNFTLPGDISASDRYYEQDITPKFELENGQIRVPGGAGIGVSPIDEHLERFTTSVRYLTPDR